MRRHFNRSPRLTGLVGPNVISHVRKKVVSPRQALEGGERSTIVGYIPSFSKSQVPQYRPTRKRSIEHSVVGTSHIYTAKNWTDASGYPAELPLTRSPRKKQSPRAHQLFGLKRVLDAAQTSNQATDMFDHRNIQNDTVDGYVKEFSMQQKARAKAMDMWQVTKSVPTLMRNSPSREEGRGAGDL